MTPASHIYGFGLENYLLKHEIGINDSFANSKIKAQVENVYVIPDYQVFMEKCIDP
jgi:hypothetical protein